MKTGTFEERCNDRRTGTVEHVYDMFIKLTKNGAKAAVFSFNSAVGNGSILNDFVLPLLMSVVMSLSVAG